MDDEQYKSIRATFPWRRMKHIDKQSGIPVYRLVNKHGDDVPIFDLMAVMEMLTNKLAR